MELKLVLRSGEEMESMLVWWWVGRSPVWSNSAGQPCGLYPGRSQCGLYPGGSHCGLYPGRSRLQREHMKNQNKAFIS